VLTFPPEATGEPITYNLIRKFDIMVNIVKADVSPGQVGHLVMEMSAPSKVLKDGIEYMKQQNVDNIPEGTVCALRCVFGGLFCRSSDNGP